MERGDGIGRGYVGGVADSLSTSRLRVEAGNRTASPISGIRRVLLAAQQFAYILLEGVVDRQGPAPLGTDPMVAVVVV